MDDLMLPPLPEPMGEIEIECGKNPYGPGVLVDYIDGYTADQMREYARKAVGAEREACAKVCEDIKHSYLRFAIGDIDGRYDWKADGADDCADEIRARR